MKVKPYIKTASGNAELTMDKSVVGLSNVDNTSDEDKPLSSAQRTVLQNVITTMTSHTTSKENPHAVTKTQVGLSNVDNVRQYSVSNPPPYPVTSVGGYTGTVTAATIQKLARDKFYPIGSLYLAVTKTPSPAELFGGTWKQLTHDAYLKIVTDRAGGTGGTANHTLTNANLPERGYEIAVNGTNTGFVEKIAADVTYASNWRLSTASVAVGGKNQPYYPHYYGVYIWERTG